MEGNIITTLLASVGGGLITWVATRVFSKSEDSASKTYVDNIRDKLDDKISRKVDKEGYNIDIANINKKLDMLIEYQMKKSSN